MQVKIITNLPWDILGNCLNPCMQALPMYSPLLLMRHLIWAHLNHQCLIWDSLILTSIAQMAGVSQSSPNYLREKNGP
jgi:hypothetical protein